MGEDEVDVVVGSVVGSVVDDVRLVVAEVDVLFIKSLNLTQHTVSLPPGQGHGFRTSFQLVTRSRSKQRQSSIGE